MPFDSMITIQINNNNQKKRTKARTRTEMVSFHNYRGAINSPAMNKTGEDSHRKKLIKK